MLNYAAFLSMLVALGCGAKTSVSDVKQLLHSTPQWSSVSTETSPIQSVAKGLVVLSADGKEVGTGLIVSSSPPVIITAGHVAAYLKIILSNHGQTTCLNSTISCSITAVEVLDDTSDFAFLSFQASTAISVPAVSISSQLLTPNESIYVLGRNIQTRDFEYSPGFAWPSGSTNPGGPFFEHNCDTLPGFSGGPIFNTMNQLVGVHKGFDGTLNYGVPSSLFSQSLGSTLQAKGNQ